MAVVSAGVVLAGGRSSRMGTPKAALEWHGSTLLRRTAGIVARAANGPVVVVRAPRQELPALPEDVALPFARGYKQPLTAAYRVSLSETAERLVKEDRLRPASLFEQCQVETLDDDALRQDPVLAALDPDLDSLLNVNTPADYEEAVARAAPEVTVQFSGDRGPRVVRATTVGAAANAVGVEFDRHVTAALDGGQITRDGTTPLAAGDTVCFMSADSEG